MDRRHLNTSSDTELLLNVLAHELQQVSGEGDLSPEQIFASVARLHERVRGSYAVIALLAGHGLLAFRDPFGICLLTLGKRVAQDGQVEWAIASESLVHESGGYEAVRDIAPGEAVFITNGGEMFASQCAKNPRLFPCAFEFVYLARPRPAHPRDRSRARRRPPHLPRGAPHAAAITEGCGVSELEMSCFNGEYATGYVNDEYLAWVEATQRS